MRLHHLQISLCVESQCFLKSLMYSKTNVKSRKSRQQTHFRLQFSVCLCAWWCNDSAANCPKAKESNCHAGVDCLNMVWSWVGWYDGIYHSSVEVCPPAEIWQYHFHCRSYPLSLNSFTVNALLPCYTASECVDDIAWNVAASYSFLLDCILLTIVSLTLRIGPNTCGIDINAKLSLLWMNHPPPACFT